MPNFDFLKETNGSFAHKDIVAGIEPDSVKEISKDKKPLRPSTPKNSINRMVSQVKSSGLFSRPCLYVVVITPPPGLLKKLDMVEKIQSIGLNCETVTLPGFSVATKENKRYGMKTEYVYDKLVEAVPMSFYLSETMEEFKLFEEWMNLMYNADGRIAYETDYRGTIDIHQCSNKSTSDNTTVPEDLEVMLTATLLDAYPKSISGISMGHGLTSQISKVSTSITYRDVVYKYWDHNNEIDRNFIDDSTTLSVNFNDNTAIGNPFNALKLPKVGTLVKNMSSFLPARNPFGDLESFF